MKITNNTLSILGGKKVIKKKFSRYNTIGIEEYKAAKKVLTSKSSLKEAAKQGAMEMFQFGDEEGNQEQQNAINRRPVKRKSTTLKKTPRSKVKRTHTGRVIAPDNYNPDELNNFANYSVCTVDDFKKIYDLSE